jgi:hypothetical protein
MATANNPSRPADCGATITDAFLAGITFAIEVSRARRRQRVDCAIRAGLIAVMAYLAVDMALWAARLAGGQA